MATLTLNINQWLCGGKDDSRESEIGINYFGNKEGVLLQENHPESKQHSMCCIGQFLSQAGIGEDVLVGFGQPSDFNIDDDNKVFNNSYNHNTEITNIFFTKNENEIIDTTLANELMEINDNMYTSVFDKIKYIKKMLEENGHKLIIEDPKGELDQIREKVVEGMELGE